MRSLSLSLFPKTLLAEGRVVVIYFPKRAGNDQGSASF